MRQRNDTGYPLHVSAWPTQDQPDRAPFDVGPGEEIDRPYRMHALTLLDPEPDEDAGEPQDAALPRSARRAKAQAAQDASAEGGERA